MSCGSSHSDLINVTFHLPLTTDNDFHDLHVFHAFDIFLDCCIQIAWTLLCFRECKPLIPQVPTEVQHRMLEPLTNLHAEPNGLLFTAFLLASIHPNADDYDVG